MAGPGVGTGTAKVTLLASVDSRPCVRAPESSLFLPMFAVVCGLLLANCKCMVLSFPDG